MSREKQIEEMARYIPSRIVAYNSDPKGQHLYIEQRRYVAEALYNAGYRKQSEVEQIFEEIEGSIAVHAFTSKSEDYADGMYDAIEWVDSKIAELKKKYTEE